MTKEQERARARRRHEEQQKSAKPPVGDSTRDKQVFGVILAVILIVAAAIVVPKLVGSSDAATPAAASTTPASTATGTPTGGLAAGQKLAAGCTAPPANQTAPKQQKEVPAKATAAGKTFVATVEDDVRRPHLRARRHQGAADRRVVHQPRQDRLLGAEPVPPRHHGGHLRPPVR